MTLPRGKPEASTSKKGKSTGKDRSPSGENRQQPAPPEPVNAVSEEHPGPTSGIDMDIEGDVSGSIYAAEGDITIVEPPPEGPSTTGGPSWLNNIVDRLQHLLKTNVYFKIGSLILGAIGILLTGLSVYSLIPKPPKPMTGEWNVAVASFTTTEGSISRKDADLIGSVFFNRLQSEMNDLSEQVNLSIQVRGPAEIGPVIGATPEDRAVSAEALAKQINADVVVYGTIARNGDSLELRPEFYVNIKNFYEAEELVGGHSLGGDIAIIGGGGDLPSQISLNRELSHRSQAMALITRGLSLYFTHAYDDALAIFEEANKDDLWRSDDGREVLYLFQGNAAGRALLLDDAEAAYNEALTINSAYSRGYAGLGSVYYLKAIQDVTNIAFEPDEDLLNKAISQFDQALTAELQPPTADIPTKVAIGLGQVYLVQWFAGQNTLQQAIDQFNQVIEDYGDGQNPRVQEFAAEAHARLGLIQRQQGNNDRAIEEFSTAARLSSTPNRRGLYWATLADLYSKLGQNDKAKDANEKSIIEYQAAMELTSQAVLRAEYWTNIAKRYVALGDLEQAIEAGSKATELANKAIEQAKDGRDLRGLQSAVNAHEELAGIELAIGDMDTAIKDYQKAIEFSSSPAQQAGYWVKLADIYDQQKDQANAEDVLNRAIEAYTQAIDSTSRDGTKAAYWAQIATLYERLGEKDKAIAALEDAIKLLPEGSGTRADYEARLAELK